MPITVSCPACGRQGRVPDSFQGSRIKCPNCAAEFHVAGSPAPAPGESASRAAPLGDADPVVEVDEEAGEAAGATSGRRTEHRPRGKAKRAPQPSGKGPASFHPACFWLGVGGALLLGIGVFVPFVQVPVMNHVSLFQGYFLHSLVILGLSAAALIPTFLGRYSLIVIPGVLAPTLLMFTFRQLKTGSGSFYDLYTKTVMKSDIQAPVVIVYSDVRIEWWGWAVMGAGILALLAASVVGSRVKSKRR